jgi:uncharacterized protein (DUF488 family)
MKVFTIGFTQKTAEQFFQLLVLNQVDILLDIRLNNKSQLAGFAKYPDLRFFLNKIARIVYIHDPMLAPTEQLLKSYRGKEITWEQYETEFETIMKDRKIDQFIQENYMSYTNQNICLLCSEPTVDQCHRRLIANHFSTVFHAETIHL